MITLSLVCLIAAIIFLVLWIVGTIVLLAGLVKIIFFICAGLFLILLTIGIFSKPPKV
jgi:hypothetical protein